MSDFRLPDLGEGLDEAELIAWRVRVGDSVAVDQIVADVETAKAAVELPIPFAGLVTRLHAEPGTTVPVGAPLISVTDAPAGFGPDVAAPDAEAEASGNVLVGYGTSRSPERIRSLPRRGPRRSPAQSIRPPATPRAATTASSSASSGGPVPVISPLVRKLARDAGLDLASISGSGVNGLVRRADIDREVARREQDSASEAAGEPAAEKRITLRGARKSAAEKFSRSRREIPEATVWVDVDATALLLARSELNARPGRPPVSLLALFARFAILGLRAYPELNAHLDGDDLVIPPHVNLGFAAQTPHGLVVPVVRQADRLSTRELSSELALRTAAAREGQLRPTDLIGGTFTVNNYGVFGVDGSAAIINYPEVAILGLGRIIDRPWVTAGEVSVRKVAELTLAFDHRACDGGTAGGYLRYVADCVETPVMALGDL